VQTVESMAQVH